MWKLCVFPSDTLASSLKKGEFKDGYFNPDDVFDEIHVISLASEEVDPLMVQNMFGNASAKVYCIGPRTRIGRMAWRFLPEFYYMAKLREINTLVAVIKPSVIRAYNPKLQGYLAVASGLRNGIPSIISVHATFDKDARYLSPGRIAFWVKRSPRRAVYDFVSLVKSYSIDKFFERRSLSLATEVIYVYISAKSLVDKYRGNRGSTLIYNRVDTERFAPSPRTPTNENVILHVGVLTFEKNPENLIRAMVNLEGKLVIVGDGELRSYLTDLVDKLGIGNKVEFRRRIEHSSMHFLYQNANLLVMCMKCGGLSIPMLEGMSCGLPLVYTYSPYERQKELVSEVAIGVNDSPRELEKAIDSLIQNGPRRRELGIAARATIERIKGQIMEKREEDVYRRCMVGEATEPRARTLQ